MAPWRCPAIGRPHLPGASFTGLDFSDQIDGRCNGLGTFVPLGRAHLSGVGRGVLGRLELAQGFFHITGNFIGVNFHGLDDAIGVDHKRTAQCQAFFVNMHIKRTCQSVGGVTNQWKLGLAHGGGGLVPHFVGKVGVGGHDVDLSTGFLEFSVVVRCVFYFSGAVEGEGCGHENKNIPLALEGFVGHGYELAVVKGFVLERQHLGIDQRHVSDFLLTLMLLFCIEQAQS
jgi:hypothetical protein